MTTQNDPEKIRSATDCNLEERSVLEAMDALTNSRETVSLTLHPLPLFILFSQLQLALRVRGNNGPAAAEAKKIARQWQKALAHSFPDISGLMEAGWNPLYDQNNRAGMVNLHAEQTPAPALNLGELAEATRDFLDLNNWTRAEGLGNVGGPRCPYCKDTLFWDDVNSDGSATCAVCNRACTWSAAPSPAGFAFHTWQLPEGPAGKGGK